MHLCVATTVSTPTTKLALQERSVHRGRRVNRTVGVHWTVFGEGGRSNDSVRLELRPNRQPPSSMMRQLEQSVPLSFRRRLARRILGRPPCLSVLRRCVAGVVATQPKWRFATDCGFLKCGTGISKRRRTCDAVRVAATRRTPLARTTHLD